MHEPEEPEPTIVAKRPSDDLLFQASEMDRALIDLLARLESSTRWPAFNAVRHLNRAWRIRNDDPEMAAFRSITAVEEAATSIFLALKRHRYQGADKLKPRDHVQKNAVLFFFDAMTRVLATIQTPPPIQLKLDKSVDPPNLVIQIQLPHPTRGIAWATPRPPLHFTARHSVDGGQTYRVEDFAAGLAEVATQANATTISDHLRKRANERNRLLYASTRGYPTFSGDIEKVLRRHQRDVFTLIRLYLLIDPYPTIQSFVQQALLGFLKMLDLFAGDIEFA